MKFTLVIISVSIALASISNASSTLLQFLMEYGLVTNQRPSSLAAILASKAIDAADVAIALKQDAENLTQSITAGAVIHASIVALDATNSAIRAVGDSNGFEYLRRTLTLAEYANNVANNAEITNMYAAASIISITAALVARDVAIVAIKLAAADHQSVEDYSNYAESRAEFAVTVTNPENWP